MLAPNLTLTFFFALCLQSSYVEIVFFNMLM